MIIGDCPVCGDPLDTEEADGKYDPLNVVLSEDSDLPSYHLGCEHGVFDSVHCSVYSAE